MTGRDNDEHAFTRELRRSGRIHARRRAGVRVLVVSALISTVGTYGWNHRGALTGLFEAPVDKVAERLTERLDTSPVAYAALPETVVPPRVEAEPAASVPLESATDSQPPAWPAVPATGPAASVVTAFSDGWRPVEGQASTAPKAVPVPVRRPAEIKPVVVGSGAIDQKAFADLGAKRQERLAVPSPVPTVAAAEDKRNIIERFLGLGGQPSQAGQVLAYANPGSLMDAVGLGGRPASPAVPTIPPSLVGAGVAVYDIKAGIVTMPNGERLEAHSGLGGSFDNPDHVKVRMKGPTPPGTYELTEREKSFHGVRAIRLNPVGGPGRVHGRNGLLAHTYLLGPRGDSNGCISFKDYDKFLQAYLRKEVTRIVVVASAARYARS